MLFWVVCTGVVVLVVKYYTAAEMRKLEVRLGTVKEDLQSAKSRLQEAQDKQSAVKSEEDSFEDRVRRIKEVTEDLQLRLAAKEQIETEDVSAA